MEERSRWITENARPSDGDFLHRSGVQTETKNIKAIKRTPREELYIMWRVRNNKKILLENLQIVPNLTNDFNKTSVYPMYLKGFSSETTDA